MEHVTDALTDLINDRDLRNALLVPLTPSMRTYTTSRSSRVPLRSSSPSDLFSQEHTKKRPLAERLAFHNTPQPLKRARTIASSSTSISKDKPKNKHKYKSKEDRPPKTLTQLHFTLDSSVLRTCPLCDLTYTKGAPEDETLHNSHCTRVQRGMQWRRDEERAAAEVKVSEIATGVKLKDGKPGRIISISADAGGKIGSKVCFNYHSEDSSDGYRTITLFS
jgi:N-acetyltransferase